MATTLEDYANKIIGNKRYAIHLKKQIFIASVAVTIFILFLLSWEFTKNAVTNSLQASQMIVGIISVGLLFFAAIFLVVNGSLKILKLSRIRDWDPESYEPNLREKFFLNIFYSRMELQNYNQKEMRDIPRNAKMFLKQAVKEINLVLFTTEENQLNIEDRRCQLAKLREALLRVIQQVDKVENRLTIVTFLEGVANDIIYNREIDVEKYPIWKNFPEYKGILDIAIWRIKTILTQRPILYLLFVGLFVLLAPQFIKILFPQYNLDTIVAIVLAVLLADPIIKIIEAPSKRNPNGQLG